ncbi:MAG: hypothetical protein IJQ58_04350 [Synergistaceae bacterium]|nr:hypothetical protein [Synergistaceae bacterium]
MRRTHPPQNASHIARKSPLREDDIVVTNLPFSLFREFVALLMKYNKQFIILGNKNAITYKEIFPLIMHNLNLVGRINSQRGA